MSPISASIVLYQTKPEVVIPAIRSFLGSDLAGKLYLVDNSPDQSLSVLNDMDPRIEYVFSGCNCGYGAGHNKAIAKSLGRFKYHLVLNPDVSFLPESLDVWYNYMEACPDVGLLAPKVLFPDGSLQTLCRQFPAPAVLFCRRFLPFKRLNRQLNYDYEMLFSDYKEIMDVPFISGCFMFLRNATLEVVGGFDEKIFMYMEDADLSRRIGRVYRTVYHPSESIYHDYARGHSTNFRLLYYFIKSTVYYFNKWGWFFDDERQRTNASVKKRYAIHQDG